MLRLTEDDRAVAELAAVAEHVASLTVVAAGFRLTADVPRLTDRATAPVVALLDEDDAPDAAETLGEIRSWVRTNLGMDHLPSLWRALAHQPRLLAAVWRKHELVLSGGTLDAAVKAGAALAVAQFRQSDYLIAYFVQLLRHAHGFEDRALVEATGMVVHALSFNTIAHGMLLEPPFHELTASDFQPGGRLEHARRPGGGPASADRDPTPPARTG